MKPKPLDLEELWSKEETLNRNYNGLEVHNLKRELLSKVKQRIKSACEFYLKYKDKPELLFEEKREYRVILAHLFGDDKDTSRYNEWLFKLAFEDVLKEKKEK